MLRAQAIPANDDATAAAQVGLWRWPARCGDGAVSGHSPLAAPPAATWATYLQVWGSCGAFHQLWCLLARFRTQQVADTQQLESRKAGGGGWREAVLPPPLVVPLMLVAPG